jgi:predicted permease
MVLFNIVFLKIVTILLNVLIGFLAAKYSGVSGRSMSSLLFYYITPIVFFSIPASASINFKSFTIGIIVFLISSLLCIISFRFFKKIYDDSSANLLAFSSGTANSGYFMLPLASKLFDKDTLGIYMIGLIGMSIFESSIGYYVLYKNLSSFKETIIKMVKLPILISFTLGCLFSISGLTIPIFLSDFLKSTKEAFSLLGMILVGLYLHELKKFEIDKKFTIYSFISKFLIYPLVVNILILIDKYILHIYSVEYYNALIIVSIAPIAVNSIVMSSLMEQKPERAAATVLLSCIFALLYVPLTASLLLSNINC